jgi:hypothetical protein
MQSGRWVRRWLSACAIIVMVVAGMAWGDGRGEMPIALAAQGAQLFRISGDLAPGEAVAPEYPVFGGGDQPANLVLDLASGSGSGTLSMDVEDGSGSVVFSDAALDGETLWAAVTLTPGANVFALENVGTEVVSYTLTVYAVGKAPITWSGSSRGAGTWRSTISLDFPTGGLYTFDLGVDAGRYQFVVDDDLIRKSVEADGEVAYYVPAGVHDLRIQPDGSEPETAWTVDISGPGAEHNTLPTTRSGRGLDGSAFVREWLPLYLAGPAEANFQLVAGGQAADTFDVALYQGSADTPFAILSDVQGGESVWWTADLDAGLSRIELVAQATQSLTYTLTVNARPTVGEGAPASWMGSSAGSGNQSQLRFAVDAAGLYAFDYGVDAGRYQFKIESAGWIQKTAMQDGAVTAFLEQGDHTLTVMQDPTESETDWSLQISQTGDAHDTLPYTKSGGELGGAGNPFDEAWMPLELADATSANVYLELDGDLTDGMRVVLHDATSATPVYTSPVVYGGERVWWTTDLASGLNGLHVKAEDGNAAPLSYALSVAPLPSPTAAWQGVAKGGAGRSVVRFDVPAAGLYRVDLDTPVGFAQVQVDENGAPARTMQASGHTGGFDIDLEAGTHDLTVVQADRFPMTTWVMSVTEVTADGTIARFTGALDAGEQVDPQLPVPATGARDVNFRLTLPEIAGTGSLTLTLTDDGGTTVFTGTALDGESVWGTAMLSAGANTFSLENGDQALTYDLEVYEVAETPYDWEGRSLPAGLWDSHIKLDMPEARLYDFASGLTAGRYQFMLGASYLQKTVETTGTVRTYAETGTHVVTVVPDRSVGAAWSLDVTSAAPAADSLPTTKAGGQLGTAGAFDEAWMPLHLDAAAAANVSLTVDAAESESLDVALYAGTSPTPTQVITGVYGGETLWWVSDLPAGTSRLQVTTSSGGPLAYELTVFPRAQLPGAWTGASDGTGNASQLAFVAPQDGLYDFTYDVDAGRYQLLVASDAGAEEIRKTAEVSGTARYYLAAGVHTLTVLQDPGVNRTRWALDIQAAGGAYDTLPHTRTGGQLGGTDNPFAYDRLPLNLDAEAAVNVALSLNGAEASTLVAYLYAGLSTRPVYTTPVVAGGETFWWTTDLPAGVSRLQLVAQDANADPLDYEVTIVPVAALAYGQSTAWQGVSRGAGADSRVRLTAPVSGTYRVTLDIAEGFANIRIEDADPTRAMDLGPRLQANGTHLEFPVPLAAGDHLFTIAPSAAYPWTTWAATVTLESAPDPILTSVAPDAVTNEVTRTVTLTGEHFQPGLTVTVGTTAMTARVLSPTTVEVTVPRGTADGTYDVTVTNPDGQSATLSDALEIRDPVYVVYLPMVVKAD